VEEIPHDPVGTGILILGYIIVLTSWIGYSLSIKASPHTVWSRRADNIPILLYCQSRKPQ
jgi:hypothetical protein